MEIKLCGGILSVKKKVFFLAVNTGFVSNGVPDQRCIEFYRERSGNLIDCSIVGNVVITGGYGTNSVCSMISDNNAWRNLTSAISKNGTKPGIQLSSTWSDYKGIKSFVASKNENPIADYKRSIARISLQEVKDILFNLNHSIELSIDAGFKHIQIHAAHGYLFSLLADHFFCIYSDYFLKELDVIANKLREKNINSSIRFSLLTGSQLIDKKRNEFINKIMQLPFDYFDPSFGFYNINKNLIYPVTNSALKSRRRKTIELAINHPDKQIILSGKSNAIHDKNLPDNVHVGLCRDLIANPKYLLEVGNGCNNCESCHYYSRGYSSLECNTDIVRSAISMHLNKKLVL